jgi:murein DD-endopeptidase MepM/ murein hydrolase activator NlpD
MPRFLETAALASLALLAVATLALPAEAQMRGSGRSGMMGQRPVDPSASGKPGMSSDGVERRDSIISATGLEAVFPAGFACEPVSSHFASPTRYDGSSRRDDRNGGLHGGLDISLDEGTPLLAVASGEVIALGEGGLLEGFFLWLRHAPNDTGLPFWVFSKYQHLSARPTLKKGDRVQAGQMVALSGSTGTAGGHFKSGYPHLHLGTYYGLSEKYAVMGEYQSRVKGRDTTHDDPLILFLQGMSELSQVRGLPEERKKVVIAVVGEDGATYPPGSKVVWPVRCKQK